MTQVLWGVWQDMPYEGDYPQAFFTSEADANLCCESLVAEHIDAVRKKYYAYFVSSITAYATFAEWEHAEKHKYDA